MFFSFISYVAFIVLMCCYLATAKVALLVFAIIVGIVSAIICAGVASNIAEKKGYPPTAWGVLGLFAGFIGCFIACLLPDLKKLMGHAVVVEENKQTSSIWQGAKQKITQLIDKYAERKWTCSCGQENRGVAKACINCGRVKGDKRPSINWTCSCGAENDGGLFCEVCGKHKPNQSMPKQVVETVEKVELPKQVVETVKKVELPTQVVKPIKKVELPNWTCSCGQENRGVAKACINCGKAKQ